MFFSTDLQKFIKPFNSALNQPIGKMLPQGYLLTLNSHAAGPGKRLHHGGVLFWMVDLPG
jgi:hypothetical protein